MMQNLSCLGINYFWHFNILLDQFCKLLFLSLYFFPNILLLFYVLHLSGVDVCIKGKLIKIILFLDKFI